MSRELMHSGLRAGMTYRATCPACGRSGELPAVSPELLFFLYGDTVKSFVPLPDTSGEELYVIAVNGVTHTIKPHEFAHYQRLCAHSADFTAAAA